MALPSGYTPLEYIESTGSQYVDTKLAPTQDTRVVFSFYPVFTRNTAFFGSRTSSSAKDKFLTLHADDTGTIRDDYGSENTSTELVPSGHTVIDKNKNATTINGTKITHATATFTGPSLFLFAINNGGTPSVPTKIRLTAYVRYDKDSLTHDCVPVQRLDGAVGLLDQIRNVFYPDAAGGNFIAGPLAAWPEAPEILEVIGTTRNAAILAWPAAPVGQSYRLYRDGVVVYEGSALCYTDAGLAAGSAHVYSVHTVIGSMESEGVTAEATTTEGIVLITDRTASDVSAGRRKGHYNALDLIRVGEVMAYLEERFADVGISVSVSPKLDWKISDIPTHAQALHYLTDIGVLRGKLTEFRETVSLPGSLTALTWGQANDIETILLDTEKLIQDIILSYRHYTGRAISGVNALP